MLLLLIFALLAGAGTALTPCVLPVLPALLSASATGGRRRPAGIVLGLVVTHTLAVVALATIIDGVGLASGTVRAGAVAVLALFGLALIWPRLGHALERPLYRLARFGPKDSGHGFWSGLAVGGALGFVYAPCAGPILAAVVAAGATGGTTGRIVAVAAAYGVGSGAVLFALSVGGRKLFERVRGVGRGPTLQRALGVVLVLTAVAMGTQADVRFQTALADHLPQFVVNPTRAIESSAAAKSRLAELRGRSRFDRATAAPKPVRDASGARSRYLDLGPAPGFAGGGKWLNTPRPLNLKALRGRVVLVDFWTYTCINCIRTLPHLRTWDKRYRRDGLTVVGVHTPEFPFERKTANVRDAIERNGLRYPVVQDNAYGIWNAFGNQYWPAKYLIDARGRVRYTHFGEGDYAATESAIRALLAESGDRRLGARAERARALKPGAGAQTPETYFGAKRAQGWLTPPRPGTRTYAVPRRPPLNAFALGGRWKVTGESATAVRDATVSARFRARRVYLVLRSADRRRRSVRVHLDGKQRRTLTVRGDDIYTAVDLPAAGEHDLKLDFEAGVSGYAFTFG